MENYVYTHNGIILESNRPLTEELIVKYYNFVHANVCDISEEAKHKTIDTIHLTFFNEKTSTGRPVERVHIELDLLPEDVEHIRRITGYLVGTLDKFNDGKKAEEKDRVKHMAV